MTSIRNFKHIAFYSSILAVSIFILKWIQWKFLITDNNIEIYIGLIALLFSILGIWVSSQFNLVKKKSEKIKKEVVTAKSSSFIIDTKQLVRLEISPREYDVLKLLAKGKSNASIAEELFLSISTIKTHISNLHSKLDVKNRTQAVLKAKDLKIIE